jgi:heme/copper-type cytochrome/quinol oxidase subunit 4
MNDKQAAFVGELITLHKRYPLTLAALVVFLVYMLYKLNLPTPETPWNAVQALCVVGISAVVFVGALSIRHAVDYLITAK